MRGPFDKDSRMLRRKNYQMGDCWCCSVKPTSKAGSAGVSHLSVSGSLGVGAAGRELASSSGTYRTRRTNQLVDMGTRG